MNHRLTSKRQAIPRSHRRRGIVVAAWLIPALILLAPPVWATDAEDLKAYQQQFQALAADDVEGHVKLALWCRDNEAWDLLVTQCDHVLDIEPDHRLATLLRELGQSKGGKSIGKSAPPDPGSAGTPGKPKPKKPNGTGMLTEEQVQLIRRAELKLDAPERGRVTFRNDVIERFWNYVALREGLGKRDEVMFRKLPPIRKAQLMIGKVRQWERQSSEDQPFLDEFLDDVILESDPWILQEYKRRVWPIIARGCATSGCHSGPKAADPVFFNERRMTDEMHYTNFLILQEYEDEDKRLINRGAPGDSLLVVYGQPVAGSRATVHPGEIRPLFKTAKDRNYVTLGQWIMALGVPKPDYGVTLDDL
jgi:hypothetical protein